MKPDLRLRRRQSADRTADNRVPSRGPLTSRVSGGEAPAGPAPSVATTAGHGLLALLLALLPALSACSPSGTASATGNAQVGDDKSSEPDHAAQFGVEEGVLAKYHAYHESIELTAAQQAVFSEALSQLPAPCCKDRTAETCCCSCNLARAWWGLTKHLIAEKGYGVQEVQDGVSAWFAEINPSGFPGDSCYTGKCFNPPSQDGCAGMNPNDVIES